jgi:hypothetical protein
MNDQERLLKVTKIVLDNPYHKEASLLLCDILTRTQNKETCDGSVSSELWTAASGVTSAVECLLQAKVRF